MADARICHQNSGRPSDNIRTGNVVSAERNAELEVARSLRNETSTLLTGRCGEPTRYAHLLAMDNRPRSITIISCLFIAFGSISFFVSLLPYVDMASTQRLAYLQVHWIVHFARLLALVSGAFMLYGFNWARWLLLIWMVFHLIISILHSPLQVLMHGLIFAVLSYFVFRPSASAYFRGTTIGPPPIPK